MKKIFCFIVLSFGLISTNFAPPKLVKVKINEDLTLSVPETFIEMSEDEMAKFYMTSKKPAAVFCEQSEKKIQVAVSSGDTPWGDDVELLQKIYRKSISNSYPKVTFLKEEIFSIKKKKFALFEFIGEVAAEENPITPKEAEKVSQYHLMLYGVHNEQIIIINFNCPSSKMKIWSRTAREIMKSVKLERIL